MATGTVAPIANDWQDVPPDHHVQMANDWQDVPVDHHLAPPVDTDPTGMGQSFGDLAKGFGSGVVRTGLGAYGLAQKGANAIGVHLPEPAPVLKAAAEPPNSPEGKIGKYVETAGEFMVPGGIVGDAAKGLEGVTAGVRGARAINALGRGALEGASAAGVTGVQTGGDTGQMKRAALVAGPLGAAGSLAGSAAPALQESAEKGMSQALGATKETMKNASARVVPQLVQRGVWAFTRKGLLNKATGEMGEAGQRLEDGYNALPPNAKMNISPMLQDLENAKQEFVVKGTGAVGHPEAYQNLTDMQAKLVKDLGPSLNGDVSLESARSLRQILDKQVAASGGYFGKSLSDAAVISAKKAGADAIRREISAQYPDIAKLNAEFNFWKNVQTVLGATVKRTESQNIPMSQQIGGLAGAVVHGVPGAVIGKEVVQLIGSPGWRMVSAVNKAKLADLLAAGQGAQASSLAGKLSAAAMSGAPVGPQQSAQAHVISRKELEDAALANGQDPELAIEAAISNGIRLSK